MAGAVVVVAGTTRVTDAAGVAVVPAPAGEVQVTVARDGFAAVTVPVTLAAGQERVVRVELEPELTLEEEVTVVATTRTGRRIEDQPIRVEALDREEIEEKMLMTPGDIVMMLNEMGGMRVQTTSPSLGGRERPHPGHAGPLHPGPLRRAAPLRQPARRPGAAPDPADGPGAGWRSSKGWRPPCTGPGAMGGVVNLLSRRPGDEAERENPAQPVRRGGPPTACCGCRPPLSETWGMTLVGGGHRQVRTDVDGDGWTDMAGYRRGVVRPRFFRDDGQGRALFLTAGATRETRTGGTEPGRVLPAVEAPYREALDTRRQDLGVLWQTLAGRSVVTARAAVARQWHEHRFGETLERDRHDTGFAEIAVRRTVGRHTWVAGGRGRARRLPSRRRPAVRPRPSPRRACSCRTTSTCGRGWPCR